MAIWYVWQLGMYNLWQFGKFFPILVCLDQEKSGNPELDSHFLIDCSIQLCRGRQQTEFCFSTKVPENGN
jgi:hypothetical protein